MLYEVITLGHWPSPSNEACMLAEARFSLFVSIRPCVLILENHETSTATLHRITSYNVCYTKLLRRSSARETAMRVAAGAIAKKYLKQVHGIEIYGYLEQLGPIKGEQVDKAIINQNDFFFADASKLAALDAFMRDLV